MKDDFDCSSLKELKELMKKNRHKQTQLQKKFDEEFDAFEEEWADALEESP